MAWSREETIGREEMQRIQLGKWQKMVSYVHAKNPVYRKKLDEAGVKPGDIRSLDDVRRLPFTTKVEIRDYYPFGLFTAAQEDIVEFHATSGTTGKMVVVGYTRNDVELWTEVMARACTGAGITKNDIVQNIYGYGLFTGGLGTHYGAMRVGAAVIPISGGNTQKQIMLMQDFGSTVVTSTPSFLMRIHEVGVEMGVDLRKLKLRIGLLRAEARGESVRAALRAVARCVSTRVRPQTHGSTVSREMSRVRYRISGWPSLAKFVMMSSPSSPYGSTSPVSGFTIST